MAPSIPESKNTVRVRAIDTKCDTVVDARAFIQPVHKGHETLNLPTLAFLIDNEKLEKRVLFDCGARKDFSKYAPGVLKKMDEILFDIVAEKDIDEILEEADVAIDTIDSMIWSHWHWDHHGAPEKFPKKVDIVVGPGFKKAFMPGFPTNPNAILADIYFEGREVRELSFDESSIKVGSFPAIDYFGDGSFYLLDSPGHAIGHMCALARTTPNTFVFLGGDICHSPGNYRPTNMYPLPEMLPNNQLDPSFPTPCPCSLFTPLHRSAPDEELSRTTPFFDLSKHNLTVFADNAAAMKSVAAMQEFEESEDVLVAIAHDMVLTKILPVLNNDPTTDINDWKAMGLKEKARWFWLNELPRNEQPGQPKMANGRHWLGKKIESFTECTQ